MKANLIGRIISDDKQVIREEGKPDLTKRFLSVVQPGVPEIIKIRVPIMFIRLDEDIFDTQVDIRYWTFNGKSGVSVSVPDTSGLNAEGGMVKRKIKE
jgi:hypothetical protein